MSGDVDILLTLARVLGSVEVDDGNLAHFDVLAAHLRSHGGYASKAMGLAITHQLLTISTIAMIANWHEGGADAALSLPVSEDFEATIAADDSPNREVVKQTVSIVRSIAWAYIGDQEKWHEAGKALLELTLYLLGMEKDQGELAISSALASRDLLERFGDPDAGRAQLYAYRILVSPKQLPFLPDLPPMKFPPPIAPAIEKNLLLDLCLQFIERGVLDQAIDLAASASLMRDDPEAVIDNRSQVEIDGEIKSVKFELAFGRKLIDWAFEEDAELGIGIGADYKLRALLPILCNNKSLLEGFRDDDFVYIYQIPYLGVEEPPKNRLDLCLRTESIKDIVRCVVGLSMSDVRMSASRDLAFSSTRRALLDHIRVSVAGDH